MESELGVKLAYSGLWGIFEANSGCNNHTKSGKIFIDKNVSENSLSLFKILSGSQNMQKEVATFGAGCFWCTEAIFRQIRGVLKVVSGYSGGAEVVQITFAPQIISYKNLLEVFWHVHDPTTLNRQGNDIGPQYRSVIFYHNQDQRKQAEQSRKESAVTEIVPFEKFDLAQSYHQDYYLKNPSQPYCRLVISLKLQKFKKEFQNLLQN